MPVCPFCGDYQLSEEELMSHITQEHPDKLLTPENYENILQKAMSGYQKYMIAANLTHTAIVADKSAKEVVEQYKRVLQLLISNNIF